jgi:carboxymethylenebutenolidase
VRTYLDGYLSYGDNYLALCPGSVGVLKHPSIGLAGMHRRDEAQRLEVRAPSILRDGGSRGRVGARKVSPSAARQLDKPKTRTVTFQGATEKVTGLLVSPRDPECHRAIIVIHEWWGLNEWVKEQAVKLAANGYVALAVDLYHGRVTADPSEARKLKRGLRQERAIGDLNAAFDYLADRPDVDPRHIGSLGWSMGGGLAVQLAIHEPRLAACVVNYGPLPTNTADIQKINAPVLGIFGSLDRGIPSDKIRAFEERMKAAGKRVDIEIYDSAGHAFENAANKRGYQPAAAADAWFHTLEFFKRAKRSRPAVP